MTSENEIRPITDKGDVINTIVLESPTGWQTVFEKWESGLVTRRFIPPRQIKHKKHPKRLTKRDFERYEFDWAKGVVVDKANK